MTNMKEIAPFYHSSSGDTEEDKKLLEPFKYILQCNEKSEFTKITSVYNYWFKIPTEKVQQINEIINISCNICIV
ncbi:PREDICTED: geranylgeranyl pyrophosphate synthase-like [Wasmannia auropunctata]|uniref:geranylgeranyl pyrophosphate synthase-like n=1 Tax=Wasmannia auropunctata TaxID=64793 RepID=UPI0005EF2A1A|nr:PREDICTED: geranylgeranyl pyrophosphate synthase-like [Wasmannia auropunctata]